jgi:hypothetical protein
MIASAPNERVELTRQNRTVFLHTQKRRHFGRQLTRGVRHTDADSTT